MTKFEAARVIGLRAQELGEGAQPLIVVEDPLLRANALYVAALEVASRRLDAIVERPCGSSVRVVDAVLPSNVRTYLDTFDA